VDNIQAVVAIGLVLSVLSLFWYACAIIRGVGEDVRDAIVLQTQAIERHTSFVHWECERDRMARLQTPQGESRLPPPPRVPSFSPEQLGGELTEQGFRNTQRRL
jgi:predicted small secreted protein